MTSRRTTTASALLLAGMIGTGCTDSSPSGPGEPLPVTTTPEQVETFVTIVSADAQNRILQGMSDRTLARDVAQHLARLDAALAARDRTRAESALDAARATLDRASAADLGDAHAVHLALNMAAQLLGLPLSAMRNIAGTTN